MTDPLQEIGKLQTKDDTFTLEWIHQDFIGYYWPVVMEHLTENSELWEYHETPEDIMVRLKKGELQLHVVRCNGDVIRAIGMTQFVPYLTGRVDMVIYWVSGEKVECWFDLLDSIEMWGAQKGAQRCRVVARTGWSRPLRNRGYGMERVVLCKSLVERMN